MSSLSKASAKGALPPLSFGLRLLALLTLLVPFLPSAHAIGISPPEIRLDYIPSQTYDLQVRLINYNDFPVNVEVRDDGGVLAAGSYILPDTITIQPHESTIVPLTLRAPPSIDRPGFHSNYIFFKESYVDKVQGSFAVRTEVGLRITYWLPYPGHYAEVIASAPSVAEGNDTVLKVVVQNLGVEPVVDGKATVRVLSATGDLEDTYTFPDINVAGNSNQQYVDVIPSKTYKPGRYTLQATLIYGENTSTMEGSFIVGTQDVDVLAVEGPLYLDKPVNKFLIHVESLWNLPLDNVYGSFELGSGKTQTPSISLTGFGKAALEGYWETDTSLAAGKQMVHVTVFFPGGSKDVLMPVDIVATSPVKNTGGAAVETPGVVHLSGADLVFIVIAVVIVGCLVMFAFSRLRKKDGGEPPNSGASVAASPTAPQPAAIPSNGLGNASSNGPGVGQR